MATNTHYTFCIENPCPMAISAMKTENQDFYCRRCAKTIVDFRGLSPDEVGIKIGEGACGIFTADQLNGQPSKPLYQRFLFRFFTLLSVFGIFIGPVQAQTREKNKQLQPVDASNMHMETIQNTSNPINLEKNDGKKEKKQRRKKRYKKIIGVPIMIRE